MMASSTLIRAIGVASLLAWGGLAGSPAWASGEEPNVLTDSFQLSLGSYLVNSDTNMQLNGVAQEGTKINWEDTFGGGDVNRFRVDGQWRFLDRQKVRFMWFNNSRSSQKTINQEIIWDGVTYPVNAKVKGDFAFDVYELAYEYAFMKSETFELDGSIGLHWTTLSAELSAKAATSGGTLTQDVKSEGSVNAPLPVIGIRGIWALPYNLSIDANAQFFALSMDGVDGNLQDYRATLTWQPKKWLGIGLGYDYFSMNVDVNKDKFNGSLDWQYDGPMMFYSVSF